MTKMRPGYREIDDIIREREKNPKHAAALARARKRLTAVLAAVTLTALVGCASQPITTEVIVPVPCPKKPHVERPVLQKIPDDAAVDQIMVAVKRALVDFIAYADVLDRTEGCK